MFRLNGTLNVNLSYHALQRPVPNAGVSFCCVYENKDISSFEILPPIEDSDSCLGPVTQSQDPSDINITV